MAKTILLWFFILLKMGLQYFLINPIYQLHRDEYLHLDQGKHLAWGYLSVPPVTSWVSYLILRLGNDVFWVKFFPAIFGALTLVVVWKAVEELKGNIFALTLSAVAVTFSAILRINLLYQPNSLDILCWTFLFFTLLKYIRSENPQWFWWAALTVALGILNKYNIVFLLIGLLSALMFTEHRFVFLQKQFYFALTLTCILISPNLAWQFQNDFPVFHHLQALAEVHLVNVKRMDILKELVLFFFGSIFIIFSALLSFFTHPPFKKYQLFFYTFLFTIILFIYLKGKAYYAIGLFPILLAFGAVYVEKLLNRNWKRYLRPIAVLLPILFFVSIIKVAFPVLSPVKITALAPQYKAYNLFRWEDGNDHSLPQDFADMLGWQELAQKVDDAYQNIPEKAHTLVLCDNYGQAGAINFYTRHPNIQAVSMHADYINWFPLGEMEIRNVIRVAAKEDYHSNIGREEKLFRSVLSFGKIKSPYARETGTRIYLLQGAKISINEILQKEINQKKNFR